MVQKFKGFTLMELLIVVVIFGILMGLAIYSFGNLGELSSEDEAEKITQVIKNWREIAITTQTPVEISVSGREFILRVNDTIRERKRLQKLSLGYSKATTGVLETQYNLDSDGVAFSGDKLVIDRRGAATSGAFYLTDGERDYAIGVSAAGRIKLWRWGGNGWY